MLKVTLFHRINRWLQHRLLQAFLVILCLLIGVQYLLWKEGTEFHRRSLIDSIGQRLSAIANSGALLMEPTAHGNIFGFYDYESEDFVLLAARLKVLANTNQLNEEVYTLRLEDSESRTAAFVVMSGTHSQTGLPYVGTKYTYPEAMQPAFIEGKTVVTDVYESKSDAGGLWMSAFAPFREEGSESYCVLEIDIAVDNLLLELKDRSVQVLYFELIRSLAFTCICFALFLVLRTALKRAVHQCVSVPMGQFMQFTQGVSAGRLIGDLELGTGDEISDLGTAFNQMVDRLSQSLKDLEKWNLELEDQVRKQTASIRSLLDNAGQGFLSFGNDFLVLNTYSLECLKIFEDRIEGKNVSSILRLDNREEFENWMQNAFFNQIDFSVIADLAPPRFVNGSRVYSLQWKRIEDANVLHVMLVMTDITEQEKLRQMIEHEETQFRKVLRVLQAPEEYSKLMQDLDGLLHHNVKEYDGVLLFREIHTAKGQAGSLELSELVEVLHAFEEWLEPRRKSKIEAIEIQEPLSLAASVVLNVQSQLKQIMGGAYPENSGTVFMPQTLYQDLLAHLAGHESLSSRLVALRQKPVKHYFQNYVVQAEALAQKLEKLVHPLLIEGGDFLVHESPWKELASVCVHLLRNMIDHGIELPEVREDSGKDPEGFCKIVFLQENGETVIEFHDDGRGIDPEKIGDILVRKCLKSREEVLQMSPDELVHSIFLPGFSSADAVTEFSGRGVGLDAVHGMVLNIGGRISVKSSLGEGTTFSIILPFGN